MSKSLVLQAFIESPWAILPSKLVTLGEIVFRHVNGEKLTEEEVQARIHGASRPAERRVQSVAVLPLFGTIFPRANMMTDVSGATSAERFGAQFTDLVNDPTVGAIVLDVNSPGGQINGVPELSTRIFEARGRKPIVAVSNHEMASAAYWIASAADEIVAAPSSGVGSIGVFSVHQDISEQLKTEGVNVTLIKAGKYKAEANPYGPLNEEARTFIQNRVDDAYNWFVEAVARNRNVKTSTVRDGFGEGRMVTAQQAVSLGMADRVETLESVINELLMKVSTAPAVMRADEVNQQPKAVSSDTAKAEIESQAQSLLDRANKILNKEK